MIEVILITAVLRSKNLPYIFENIKTTFKEYKEISVMWSLCFDMYNSEIDNDIIENIIKQCIDENIRISVYYQGLPGIANYGGNLFNKPLSDLKCKSYPTSNPFLYILDDDNILSSNFPKFLINMNESKETNQYSVWWTNMVDEFGSHYFARNADALAYREGFGRNKGFRIIHPCASLDPSQMISTLDFILEMGGFAGSRDYDYKFMTRIYYDPRFQNKIWYQGNDPWIRNGKFISSTTYHNALVKRTDIVDTINSIDKDSIEDSYIKVHVNDKNFIIPLNNKQLKEILKIAKNYKI